MATFLLVWFAILASPVAQSRCDIGVGFRGPTADRAVVLAVAAAESVPVPLPDRWLLSERWPDTVRTVPAYRFHVIEVAGGGDRFRPGNTILVAPWKYDSACDLLPWEPEAWVPAGAEVVFSLNERRAEITGEPLYDDLGWHSPYPHGEFLQSEAGRGVRDREAWLSAREYFELLRSLPEDRQETPAQRLARIERVLAEGAPRWRTSFPGTEILRRAQVAASRGSEGP